MASALKPESRSVRWVRAENLHLTLKFLGEVTEKQVQEISEALRNTASAHSPLRLSARGTGAFPNERRPRVIWAGLEDNSGLLSLHSDIEGAMEGLGFKPEDREFRAHLTIGRVKGPKGLRELMGALKAHAEDDFGEFEASEIVLFKSDLQTSGAVHTVLSSFKLG